MVLPQKCNEVLHVTVASHSDEQKSMPGADTRQRDKKSPLFLGDTATETDRALVENRMWLLEWKRRLARCGAPTSIQRFGSRLR